MEGGTTIELEYIVASPNGINAYPNPLFSGRTLTVETDWELSGDEKAEVFNLTGALVNASISRDNTGYRIDGLTIPGTYLVKITTPGKSASTVKIVVK